MNDSPFFLQESTIATKEMILSMKKTIKSFLRKNLTVGTFLNYVKSLFKKKNKFNVMDMINNLKLAIFLGIMPSGINFFDALKNSYEKNVYLTTKYLEKSGNAILQRTRFAIFLTLSDLLLNTAFANILLTTSLGKMIKDNVFSFAMAIYTWGYLTIESGTAADFPDILAFYRGRKEELMTALTNARNEFTQQFALSATLSPIFEESSKKVAEETGTTAYYFAIFNAAEFTNYVRQMTDAGMHTGDAVVARLKAIGGHAIFTMLHKYGFPNSALMAHMLWNFLAVMSPIMQQYIEQRKEELRMRA